MQRFLRKHHPSGLLFRNLWFGIANLAVNGRCASVRSHSDDSLITSIVMPGLEPGLHGPAERLPATS